VEKTPAPPPHREGGKMELTSEEIIGLILAGRKHEQDRIWNALLPYQTDLETLEIIKTVIYGEAKALN